MPTLSSNGTQTATIGTEHTLYNPTTNKWFSGYVDLTNMASGDATEIRVYVQIKSGGSLILYSLDTLNNVPTNPLYFIPSLPSDISWKITLKQTTGTGRTYDWRIFEVS